MPKDKSIRKVLVVGSGPIVIGQAAEFDYSGTQACRALKEEGVKVVLLNPNPATIMTDRDIADRVYLEPLTVESAIKIIADERPDGFIATMGGQAGLNMAMELSEAGVFEKYGVRVLGTGVDAIRRGEDREYFKETMISLGQPVPASMAVTSMDEVEEALKRVGLPCVIRPAFTLGGTGGGFATTREDFEVALEKGLAASPVHQVLVEASLFGQKEIEFEVVRDSAGNSIAVCSMENLDPMGIHTGDSIVVAPTLTLDDQIFQKLRLASLDLVAGLGVEGACNVQMSLSAEGEYNVIEVNPRVSRSSALASKATGYPIARVATKIALGFSLYEIANEVTGKTTACHEPAIDYVALKIPRWPWDKFPGGQRDLGLQMKSTGEVMAIGRTFEEALGKGISSLDQKGSLWDVAATTVTRDEMEKRLRIADDTRLSWVLRALRDGMNIAEVSEMTGIDPFFVERMRGMVHVEKELSAQPTPQKALADGSFPRDLLRKAKTMGLSDLRIAGLLGVAEEDVAYGRKKAGIIPGFRMVDTCAGEFEATTPYYYSSYDGDSEAQSDGNSVIVLGGGPIRIGQGIEFDYCAVHAAWSLEKEGYTSVIVNNNPETVSTDFNTAGRLYFEPLTFEHVMSVIDVEKPAGVLVGFGGQTAINLVESLDAAGVKILGTGPDAIDATEDRGRFVKLLHDLGIPAIPGTIAFSKEQALDACRLIHFPVVVRPSYVLGGRGMAIVQNEEELLKFWDEASEEARGHGVLVDKYILATEVEVDVVSDGIDSYVPVILEHIERAGVHSGDSIAQIPPRTLTGASKAKIIEYTNALCRALSIKGIANIQYIVDGETVFCLEVNPRASRTVPFVTKVTGFPLIRIATGLSLGRSLKSYGPYSGLGPTPSVCAVKMPVFSWNKMRVDPVIGPEMKSTGEIMGMGMDLDEALQKAFVALGVKRMGPGTGALLTIADRDKPGALPIAQALDAAGWTLYATEGTADYLGKAGVKVNKVKKVDQEDGPLTGFSTKGAPVDGDIPGILQTIVEGRVQVVINTFTQGGSQVRDGFRIRALAVLRNIPVLTCLETASALAKAASAEARNGRNGNGHHLLAIQDVPPSD